MPGLSPNYLAPWCSSPQPNHDGWPLISKMWEIQRWYSSQNGRQWSNYPSLSASSHLQHHRTCSLHLFLQEVVRLVTKWRRLETIDARQTLPLEPFFNLRWFTISRNHHIHVTVWRKKLHNADTDIVEDDNEDNETEEADCARCLLRTCLLLGHSES